MATKALFAAILITLTSTIIGCDRAGQGRIRIEIRDDVAASIASAQPDASTGVELERGTFVAGLVLQIRIEPPGVKIVPAESTWAGLPIGTIEVSENWFLHRAEPIEIDPALAPFVRRNEVRRFNDGWDVEQRIVVTRSVKLVRVPTPTAR